jgi:crotonobetainyl-CoA:carnitine CoA-transferase CaiB-like acyl-CoA transferase
MTGILKDLKIIDMGHFVAVPAAGALFADWGADVLKIEPIDGDAQRGHKSLMALLTGSDEVNWRFEVHNRNKRSLALDLKKKAGTDILYKLIEKADVFMTNYEMAAIKKLKLNYENLCKINPRIIYAFLTGYGTIGPDKDERGFDFAAAWARSGIQHLIGEPGCAPPQQRGGMMDRTVGTHMVAGILAALFHREKTGQGQEVEFSLYHSGVWTLAADLQVVLGGQLLTQNDRTKAPNPLWNNYQTREGRWLQMAMLQADLSWPDFCLAIERPDLEKDPRFHTLEKRGEHCEELIRILDEIFASKDRKGWERRLKENHCIFGRIETPEEVINDPQAMVNGFFAEIEHPAAGLVKYITTPVKFRQNPASVRTPSPEIGQHTEEILLELGYSWDELAVLKEQGVIPA